MIAEKINVHGVAVRPGVSRNGINYTPEELQKFAGTLQNRPILKDHNATADNTVGVLTSSIANNEGIVNYNGWVKEDGTNLLEKIKDGRLKEVSIGAIAGKFVKENDNDDFVTAVDLEGMELSIVSCPGVKGTSISQTMEALEKRKLGEKVKVKPISESVNMFKEFKEVKKMAEDEKPKEEPKLEVPEENKEEPKEEVKKEEKKEEKSEEIKQSVSVGVDMDSSKLDETIKKLEKIAELKEKVKIKESETKEKVEDEKKETKEKIKVDNTKGKVTKEEITTEDVTKDFVVENAEFGNGVAIWKEPKADGSY